MSAVATDVAHTHRLASAHTVDGVCGDDAVCVSTAAALLDAAAAVADVVAAGGVPGGVGSGAPRVGVDLGTASCVLVVLAGERPVWVGSRPSGALRDGVIVDFAGAVETVRELRAAAGQALGVALAGAATAHPPCVPAADARACTYVCEAAGFDGVVLVDEVSAAQRTLGVRDGVIVDVGGGSTGVGVFRGGELVALDDRPGGGHHLDLILAGALGLPVEEAEVRKRTDPDGVFGVLVPGLQRIAENVRALTAGHEDLPLHLAGGALMLPGAAGVIGDRLGREVVTHPHALLITPVGIARCVP